MSQMLHFYCPWCTLLATVLVIHIDPLTSIPISCWRQYCFYISTSRDLGLMVRRLVERTLGICSKTLKCCQVNERSGSSHHLTEGALEIKVEEGKKTKQKKTNKIKIVNQYSCHHSQSETCGDTSHSLPCLGSGHCRGRFEFKDVKNASCPPTFSRMSLTLYVLK